MRSEAETGSVNERHPLRAALAAYGEHTREPRMDVGVLEPGWITAAALFADDAALDDHLAYQGSFHEKADRKSCAAFLLSDYCAMFSMTAVPLLVASGIVPDFAASNYAMQFYLATVEHDGHTAQLRRAHVRFLSAAFATDRDSAAAHPDAATLPGRDALCDCFRQGVEDHFSPLIEALNRKTALARSAMWRLVGDALGAAFLDAGRRHGCLEEAKAMGVTVLKQAGSPLANRQMHYFDVVIRDDDCPERILASYTFRARGGCCRYYRMEGGKLCSTCVLLDPATREARLAQLMRRRLGLPVA